MKKGAAILLMVALASCRGDDGARERAATQALALYQPASSTTLHVRQVQPRHGLYLVTLQRGDAQEFVDVYVTADGQAFTETLSNVDDTVRTLREDQRFAECLKAAGVSVMVRDGDPASAQQLDMLGRRAALVAIPCDADMANCQHLGVREFPTIRHDGKLHPGMHTVAWLETLTGCKR